jgi:hypothetical protein
MARPEKEQGQNQGRTQRDHAIGRGDGNFSGHDQHGQAANDQKHGQAQQAVMMLVGMLMLMSVMAPVMARIEIVLRVFRIQGKFVAHADVQFAHCVSIKSRKSGRPLLAAGDKIIIESSNVNLIHQKIIIPT